jgi:hypothetical protein
MNRLLSALLFMAVLLAQAPLACAAIVHAASGQDTAEAAHAAHAHASHGGHTQTADSPEPPAEDSTCTSLDRCHWAALPEPETAAPVIDDAALSRSLRRFDDPATHIAAFPTPPPRQSS